MTATGRTSGTSHPFCASYWGGRPVQDQMYSTAYLSTADWNDTKFKNAHFDELLIAARGELDQAKRKAHVFGNGATSCATRAA